MDSHRAEPLLVLVAPGDGMRVDLAYASKNNFCGRAIYRRHLCLLRPQAAHALSRAGTILFEQGLSLCVRDAFRPALAQAILWDAALDKSFVADPRLGSTHTRGIAVDVELRGLDGSALDMGSAFDEMSPASAHGARNIPPPAAALRRILAHAMQTAGFDALPHEWWHYQLPHAELYPLILDSQLGPLNPMLP